MSSVVFNDDLYLDVAQQEWVFSAVSSGQTLTFKIAASYETKEGSVSSCTIADWQELALIRLETRQPDERGVLHL